MTNIASCEPQLEYDNEGTDLIFEDEIDMDIQAFLDEVDERANATSASFKIKMDGSIEENFEEELSGTEVSQRDPIDNMTMDIENYDIIQSCGLDKFGRKIIACYACKLPPSDSLADSVFQTQERFFKCLLQYIRHVLINFVKSDYIIIYFHNGLTTKNRPPVSWFIAAYKELDRNFKKNLKEFLVVHPTILVKVLWQLLRPFVSGKFVWKFVYVDRLSYLDYWVSLSQLSLPSSVIKHDDERKSSKVSTTQNKRVFGVLLDDILSRENNEIPFIVKDTVKNIKLYGLDEPAIFRRSAAIQLVKAVQEMYDRGEKVDYKWTYDIHVAACILKSWIRELREPLLPAFLYEDIIGIKDILPAEQLSYVRDIVYRLPEQNYNVLKYIIEFLHIVSTHSNKNKMTCSNLAIVFGPCFIWPHPSKKNILTDIARINRFVECLISSCSEIFLR